MLLIASWLFQRLWLISLIPAARVRLVNLLLDRDVVPKSSKLSLDANPVRVIRAGVDRIERSAALGVRIVVVILNWLI